MTALESALDEISIDQHRPGPNEESTFYNATFAHDAAPLDPMPEPPLSPSGIEAAFKGTLKVRPAVPEDAAGMDSANLYLS